MLSGGAGVSPRAGPSNLGIALPGSNTGRRRGHGPEMKRWTLGSVAGEKQTDGGGGLPVHGDGHQGEDGRRHGDALHRAAQFAHQASEGPPCAQEAPDSCFGAPRVDIPLTWIRHTADTCSVTCSVPAA